MLLIPDLLFVAIFFAPVPLVWYVQVKLHRHRRSPRDWFLVLGFRGLRPDRYTDDGQYWLRRLSLLLILLVPWWLLVLAVFRPR